VEQALPSILPPGTLLAGKFRVLRQIGAGGMGAVYEVEHELTRHRRALKLLHEEFSERPDVVARFLREASAAGRIGSPHIVETFDAGHLESGEPYIVMELLDGQPLSDLIEQRGQLDFAEGIDLILQAAAGVQAAHEAGIIHRDLKPENVFVGSGATPFVKILDFGISKFDPEKTGDSSLTVDGAAMGTPTHMAPEQIRGQKDIDERADVYALGLVLYESVTGYKAYFADTLPELAIRIHEGKYTPVSQCRVDTPPGFDELMLGALAAEREHRYPTMAAFIQAVSAFQRRSALPGAPTPYTTGTPTGASSALQHSAAPAPAPMPGAPASAATDAGVERAQAAPTGKRFVAVFVAAGIGAIGLGLVAFKFYAGPWQEGQAAAPGSIAHPVTTESVAPDSAPPASASPQASQSATSPEPANSTTPSKPAASSTAPTAPQPPARQATAPLATTVAPAAPAAPASKGKDPEKTRAGQVGLAEDNPF